MPLEQNQNKATRLLKSNKTALLVVAATIILMIAAFLAVLNNTQTSTADMVCSDDDSLLMESSELLNSLNDEFDIEELSKIAQKIESRSSYKEDINCLYVTTRYYIYIGDMPKSHINYEIIKSLHEDGQEFSSSFTGAGVEDLERRIVVREAMQEEATQNTFVIPGTESRPEESEE